MKLFLHRLLVVVSPHVPECTLRFSPPLQLHSISELELAYDPICELGNLLPFIHNQDVLRRRGAHASHIALMDVETTTQAKYA